jgi:metal-responsive CopG/Arc/MetJ family transcriptional regulator
MVGYFFRMQGKTKVSVSVNTRLLREAQRAAGGANRSAIFDQALAHWLRERRQVELERAVEDYYEALSAAEWAEDDAWAETGDDTVRRVWNEPKR